MSRKYTVIERIRARNNSVSSFISRDTHRFIALAAASMGCAAASAQQAFVDDAGRHVTLPTTVERVFAAGAPAEVLLYTLAPEKLAGRNMVPSAAAFEFMPAELRARTPIVNLPERDDPRYDAELLALDVDVYVDYGTVDSDYVAALEAISGRTGVSAIILDGRLSAIPEVYRRLGAALAVPQRGAALAAEAQRLLDRYRGSLAAASPRVYLACSQNALTPCYRGHSAGGVAEWLGVNNVAGHIDDAARRPLTIAEIAALEPDVIIAPNADAAAALRSAPAWRDVAAVAAGRVHAPPALPFNWGPRPPSVNRLAGVVWMAYVAPNRPFDDAFYAQMRDFFALFYHTAPTLEQLRKLVAASE